LPYVADGLVMDRSPTAARPRYACPGVASTAAAWRIRRWISASRVDFTRVKRQWW